MLVLVANQSLTLPNMDCCHLEVELNGFGSPLYAPCIFINIFLFCHVIVTHTLLVIYVPHGL